MAERFLFFPSAGFCLIVAFLAEQYLMKQGNSDVASLGQRNLLLLGVPVMIAFSVITVYRNSDWKDNITLFRSDLQYAPDDAKLNYYMGTQMSVDQANAAPSPIIRRQ
jgi:hypothetical protein